MRPSVVTPLEPPKAARWGFTLIELLVVVTVIVVLLAMLTPALDRAVYKAELTVCGAGLKGMGTAMITHTLDRKRRYPERRWGGVVIELTAYGALTSATIGVQPGVDNRPPLREYLDTPLNGVLNCPLQRGVDLEGPSADTTAVAGGYALWNDWLPGPGERPMRRMGDRWTFLGDRYALLAQDYELNTGFLYSSHPDLENRMIELAYDRVPWSTDGSLYRTIDTWTTWQSSSATRGPLDRNFLYDDGSVILLGEIKMDGEDERMTIVPCEWGGGTQYPEWWERVPR